MRLQSFLLSPICCAKCDKIDINCPKATKNMLEQGQLQELQLQLSLARAVIGTPGHLLLCWDSSCYYYSHSKNEYYFVLKAILKIDWIPVFVQHLLLVFIQYFHDPLLASIYFEFLTLPSFVQHSKKFLFTIIYHDQWRHRAE